ncbi:hypothetical protein [Spiroplasma endosymbiont of Cantharis rufa]|uniref:hypothetical protein n=1 Tax=Spiroplasma endosymbiont of Cantharis rufa TaxID=3066279 RepID=UPI0030CBAFDC
MKDNILLIESATQNEADCILKELEKKLKNRKVQLYNPTKNPVFNSIFPRDFFRRNGQLNFAVGIFLEYLASAYISDKYDCFAIGWRPNKRRKLAKFGMDNILISKKINKLIILESKSAYSDFKKRLKDGFDSAFIQEITDGTFLNVKEHIGIAIEDLWAIINAEEELKNKLNKLCFKQLEEAFNKFVELDSNSNKDESQKSKTKNQEKYYIKDYLYKDCLTSILFFSNKKILKEDVEKDLRLYTKNLNNPDLEINIFFPVDKNFGEIDKNHVDNFYNDLEIFFND